MGWVWGLLTDVKGIQMRGSSKLLTASSIPATTSMAGFCSVGMPSDTWISHHRQRPLLLQVCSLQAQLSQSQDLGLASWVELVI